MLAAEPRLAVGPRRAALPGAHRPRSRSFENPPRVELAAEIQPATTRKAVVHDRRGLLKSLDDNPPHHIISRSRHLFSRTSSAAPVVLSAIFLLPNETLLEIFGFVPPPSALISPLTFRKVP